VRAASGARTDRLFARSLARVGAFFGSAVRFGLGRYLGQSRRIAGSVTRSLGSDSFWWRRSDVLTAQTLANAADHRHRLLQRRRRDAERNHGCSAKANAQHCRCAHGPPPHALHASKPRSEAQTAPRPCSLTPFPLSRNRPRTVSLLTSAQLRCSLCTDSLSRAPG